MAQSKRIETLCALLQKTRVFADIGCDHGYCTEYMLKNNLCERAIFSDISKGSLLKAKKLLGCYEKAGKATPVLGDGFFGVPKDTDEEYEFGRENLETLPKAFIKRTEKLIKNIDKYITATLSEQSRAELIERQKRLQGALKGANL